ncbi:MAG: radical SAM protein [Actinomycetota bacterium]|nr:radical SAM protein [Actinomycetota bacterium]
MDRTLLAIDLVARVGATAAGSTVQVAAATSQDVDFIDTWCRASGNSVLAVLPDSVEVYRGSLADPTAALPPERLPGYRLWMYTNFHCNLACDYCCVSSSPKASPRELSAETVAEVVRQATETGMREIYLTGGEPFMSREIGAIVDACVAAAPTVMLTNGMLFRGARLRLLEAMPREGLVLQISVDSATPDVHDGHRGSGSWVKAVDGIRIARQLGFRVRIAATVSTGSTADEHALVDLCAELNVPGEDMVVRRVAAEGCATDGIVITRESVVPEVCVTAEGVYWHPVAATNPTMRVSESIFPLAKSVAAMTEEFVGYRRRGEVLAASFPCA